MALITKIKLTPAYDWKSLIINDITGTGITGYGNNQDPIGLRQAVSSGNDIILKYLFITGPDLIEKKFTIGDMTAINSDLIISNTQLGFNIDETITDGIYKVEYVPYFDGSVYLVYSNNTLVFNPGDKIYLLNGTRLHLIDEFSIRYDVKITNINYTTGVITYTGDNLSNIGSIDNWYVGIGTTTYTAFTKEIKECLDNKIADITNCECENVDCELVNKYLLYDAIYVNCKENNVTKAQQIFNLLTTYCTDNCGC